MSRSIIGIVLFFIVILAAIPLVSRLMQHEGDRTPPEPTQSLETASGQAIQIYARPVQIAMRSRLGLYYRARRANAAQAEPDENNEQSASASPQFFGSLPPDHKTPRFVAHASEDGQLIAVAATTDPNAILVMHDFNTGASWPRHGDLEDVEQLQQRGRAMLRRFNDAMPARDLRFVPADGPRELNKLIELDAPAAQPASQK